MSEIKAPAPWPQEGKKIFLAGTIDMGNSEDWQAIVARKLGSLPDVVFLNPRRNDWDSSWIQSKDNPQFREQVEWELDALTAADFRIFVFLADSKSPITFLELGLFANKRGAVMCPPGFYRKGNVDIVCELAGMPVFESIEELCAHVEAVL